MVTANASRPRFRIGPSQLGYLLKCETCFLLQVRDRIARPGGANPTANFADQAMRQAFAAVELVDLAIADAPRFTVLKTGYAVESSPIELGGVDLVIGGKLDALVKTEHDETILVDYKTTRYAGAAKSYASQLGAYALALAFPADPVKEPPLEIDGMALLCFQPKAFAWRPNGNAGLFGPSRWLHVPQDNIALMAQLTHVAGLLEGTTKPKVGSCDYCSYRGGRKLQYA